MEGFKESDIEGEGQIFFKSGVMASKDECRRAIRDMSARQALITYVRIKKYGWPHPWSECPARLLEMVELIDHVREAYEST